MPQCPRCDYNSPSAWNVKRHFKTHEKVSVSSEYACKYCHRIFDRKYNCVRHENTCNYKDESADYDVSRMSPKVAGMSPKVAGMSPKVAEEDPKVAEGDKMDQPIENTGEILCISCNGMFANKKTLQKHFKTCKADSI